MRLVTKGQFDRVDRKAFFVALILIFMSFTGTFLMYRGNVPNNFFVYFTYPLSMLLLVFSVRKCSEKFNAEAFKSREFILAVTIVSALYFVSHFYNYANAPWNNYGLFDDAAWDIFDSRLKCFTSDSFELIFFDDIGRISRELIFHYYIAVMFRLFGYNLMTFNISLILLGWITVMFTMLTVYELSGKLYTATISGIVLMFLPLEFTQVYMGHRYAICGPLMMVSFYFLLD